MTATIHMKKIDCNSTYDISKIKQLKFPTRDYKLMHINTLQARTLILHKIPII